jgi:hypothetical protein
MLLKLEGFKYATSLDLNMGYYHIELSPHSKQLCTIVLPWGKIRITTPTYGIIMQQPGHLSGKLSTLMQDLKYSRAYTNDLLIITHGSFEEHTDKLKVVLG